MRKMHKTECIDISFYLKQILKNIMNQTVSDSISYLKISICISMKRAYLHT